MDPAYHFVEYLKQYVVGIKLVNKRDSLLMRVLGFFCFFNKRFMTHTTTALGKTIYIPSETPHDLALMRIIAHEYVHLRDFQRQGTICVLIQYCRPQLGALFSLLSLGAFWSPLWLISLASLLFLLPGNAPHRIDIERRAYGMTLLFNLWISGSVSPTQIQSTVDTLHGPIYYWPGGTPILNRTYFECIIESAKHGVLPPDPEYADVWRYLNQENYLFKKP